MPELRSMGPIPFAVLTAAVAAVVYVALAVLVFGDSLAEVAVLAAATAVGVGVGLYAGRRGSIQ